MKKMIMIGLCALLWSGQVLAATVATIAATTPTADFVVNGNGTVTHSKTSLIWKRCSEGQAWNGTTCTGTAIAYTWLGSFTQAQAVNAARFAGFTDWRVPNQKELQSIVEQRNFSPAINATIFPATVNTVFWSASSFASDANVAWGVRFNGGDDTMKYKVLYTISLSVRLVRGGQNLFFAPQANAGTDAKVVGGASVTLNGTKSHDDDGTAIVSYQWKQLSGPKVVLTGANQASASFTAPVVAQAAALRFELMVVDNAKNATADTVTITVSPSASVGFTSENMADGTILLGAGTKTWNFQAGAQALTGLKAVQISADVGLGVTQMVVAVGNVAANQAFSVSVPVNTVHSGITPKVSLWQLQNAAGQVVPISNSANNTFWLKLRTNHAPEFSPLQLNATGGAVNATVTLPLLVNDQDGDAITYQVNQVTGTGSVTGNVYSGTFATAGVHSVNITASDGIETVTKTITVVVHASTGVSNFFSDVTYPGVVDVNSQYSAIHYLALHGLVIGNSTANGQRTFAPAAQVLQAEALKMILLAAEKRGFVTIVKSNRNLPNLLVINTAKGSYQNFSWAAPYAMTAEQLGLINDAALWNPAAPMTREQLARWMFTLLDLNIPTALKGINYNFSDAVAFTTPQDYQFALGLSYHGYMGTLGGMFAPATALTRGEVAMVASKILRRPVMQNVVLSGTVNGTLRGAQVPVVGRQTGATMTSVVGLQSQQIFQSTSRILEELVNATPSHVNMEVLVNGVGSVGVRRIANLATTPLLIDTSKLGITQDTVLDLVYKLTDTASGVVTLYRQSLGRC